MTRAALPAMRSTQVSAPAPRTDAGIARFPRARLPDAVEDFGRVCARMIWAAFPGRSQNAVCEAAAMATGASPDTFDRILSGKTKHPDPRLMFVVLAIYQTRTGRALSIGGGFEIRITQTGGQG